MSHHGSSPPPLSGSPPKTAVKSPSKSPSRSPPKAVSKSSPPPTSPSDHDAGLSPAIEVEPDLDPDDQDDADSAVDAGSVASSTTSLSESILDYRKLHGRTYENIKTTEYWAPNDDQQNEGLDLIHNALLMLLDDKLYLAPIGDHPGRVLDLGTGTGIWAMDFGDQFPEAEVVGTDLSPIQPAWVPPNVEFVIDDCLLDWTWPSDHFDFVHIRAMYGSIPDWVALYRKALDHLKPGGWLQNLELDVLIQTDHVALPDDHIFFRWADLFHQGGDKMGRTFACSTGHTMRDNLEAAGFVDVVEKKIKAPIHAWPRDPRLQQAGMLLQLALEESLEGFGMFMLTQILGWQQEEVVVLLSQMRRELKKKSLCGYSMTTIVWGRKPEEPTTQH